MLVDAHLPKMPLPGYITHQLDKPTIMDLFYPYRWRRRKANTVSMRRSKPGEDRTARMGGTPKNSIREVCNAYKRANGHLQDLGCTGMRGGRNFATLGRHTQIFIQLPERT